MQPAESYTRFTMHRKASASKSEWQNRMNENYQITVQGHVDTTWSDWFNGLEISHVAGDKTIISGPVRDQAALFGLLLRLHGLGMNLVAVNQVDSESQKGGGIYVDSED